MYYLDKGENLTVRLTQKLNSYPNIYGSKLIATHNYMHLVS